MSERRCLWLVFTVAMSAWALAWVGDWLFDGEPGKIGPRAAYISAGIAITNLVAFFGSKK